MRRAVDDEYKLKWDSNTHQFTILKNNESVAQDDKVGAVWIFEGQAAVGDKTQQNAEMRVINFTARNGVADLQLWH